MQLIDLDAAKNAGANERARRAICARSLPRRRRHPLGERAQALVGLGATGHRRVRALPDGAVDIEFAQRIADAITPDRFIAAVDSRGGHVVIDGWRTTLPLTPVEAMRALEPFVGGFSTPTSIARG